MCGIAGLYGLEGVNNPEGIVARMNDLISHRGPDSDGLFSYGNVVLGHRRLSIIDLSEEANQPFHNHNGRYTIVFNGEVYNFQEIKSRLKDYQFKTKCDTEVVLAAYEMFGVDCFEMFNGMFALAIWDKQTEELIIARDRMGIKPLYYYIKDQTIMFASEIRAIMHSGFMKAELDQSGLVDYMRYQTVHAPNTIIKDVKMLMPGSLMRISDSEFSHEVYWDSRVDYKKNDDSDPEKIKKNIHDTLFNAVSLRTISDVPYGAFLSGGIDSSAIVGMMSKMSDIQINTFSVVFDEAEFSEAVYARQVSELFGTVHREIPVTPTDFLELLPDALDAMDHPSGDGPNTYVVSKVTKEAGVTMALSGLGGDELFAGYDLFKRCASLSDKRWLMSFPPAFRKPVGRIYKTLKPGISSDKVDAVLNLDYLDLEYIYPLMRQVLLDDRIKSITGNKNLPENEVFRIAQGADHTNIGFEMPYLSRISYMEFNSYMQNILLRDSDQMSMAHALEIRVPFLDHNIVEYVLGIGDKLKYPSSPKKLLIESLDGLLPDNIVNRPKMGFTFPWAHWMKNDLKDFCATNIETLKQRSYINAASIDKLWNQFLSGDPRVTWSRLWYLIVLENWIKKNDVKT
ncbi:MAG: asparagine synthase (glutamine-hydrolyzing) [Flavobacteriales bacterium]|jgi:asparagine synthase (glutamine-hydrolysing)